MCFNLCYYCRGRCCSVRSPTSRSVLLVLTSDRSFTLFISAFAAWGLAGGERAGSNELGNESDEYSDELLPGLETMEKI